MPLTRPGDSLTLAMTDPTNVFAMDDIKFMTGYNVEPVVASEASVMEAIDKYYPSRNGHGGNGAVAVTSGPSALEMASRGLEELQASLDVTTTNDVEVLQELEELSAEALAKQGQEAPIVRLVHGV